MEKRYLEIVAQTMPCKKHQIEAVLKMLEEGNTVPFIARYRKERTGSLDEVQIKDISDEYQRVEKIEKKRSDIEARIGELGKLTENLKKSIDAAIGRSVFAIQAKKTNKGPGCKGSRLGAVCAVDADVSKRNG